jgi:hypothetical protein
MTRYFRALLLVVIFLGCYGAFNGKVTVAAWHTKPSWSIIATNDHAITPQQEATRAAEIRAVATRVASSHEVMPTKPAVVASVILQAVHSVERL